MTEEEQAAAQAQAEQDAAIEAAIEASPSAEKDAIIARLTSERDNYKNVALKRLGKLEGDAEFLGDGELTVSEQIRLALLDREIETETKARDDERKRLVRENAELKLALKNRPESSIGGDTTTTVTVKDNVLTDAQLSELRAKAKRLKADPEKFVEDYKKNLLMKS